MKNSHYFLILTLLCFASCSSPEKSTQNNNVTTEPTLTTDSSHIVTSSDSIALNSTYNGDELKSIFLNAPFNYTFKDEVTVQGTSDSHFKGEEGQGDYKQYVDSPNSLIIYFDKDTRKVTSITFYLNHFNTSNIKIKHLKKLFDFLNYFDSGASKFIVKNFKSLFYDEKAYEELTPYEDKKIKMGVDHSLFDAGKAEAKSNDDVTHEEYIDVTITFL